MKKFVFGLLFLCFSAARGQSITDGAFHLKQLPAEITSQWKFHGGDNPAWRDTSLYDRDLQHIDATQLQQFLPQVSSAQIGRFRLTIHVAPALRGKTVAMIVDQQGAAEIYFNGTLIRAMGRVSADYATEQSRHSSGEPITFRLGNALLQYLAILYLFYISNSVIWYGSPVLSASYNDAD